MNERYERELRGLRRCWGQGAYSLVEVMAAVGVVGTVFAAVFSGFTFGFSELGTIRENLRATQVMQEKMETIRLYSWDQINTPQFIPIQFVANLNPTNRTETAFYSGTLLITNAPLSESYSTNLRQVTVELTWKSGGVECRRKMTSLVSRYGLQNYVY
jgi:hypothetical protein